MNLRTFTTEIASAFTLAGKDLKEPLVGQDAAFPQNHQWEEIQWFHHQWQTSDLTKWRIGLRLMEISLVFRNVIWHALSNVLSVRFGIFEQGQKLFQRLPELVTCIFWFIFSQEYTTSSFNFLSFLLPLPKDVA